MVSISQKWLNWIRSKNKNYIQIFIDVPIETLKKRNIRNIYKKKNIVGVDIKYQKPSKNDFVIRNNFTKIFLKKEIKKLFKNIKVIRSLKRL